MTENDRQAQNIVIATAQYLAGMVTSEDLVAYMIHNGFVGPDVVASLSKNG